jgi:hypothetical protein
MKGGLTIKGFLVTKEMLHGYSMESDRIDSAIKRIVAVLNAREEERLLHILRMRFRAIVQENKYKLEA